MQTDVHPDSVFIALLAAGGHVTKLRNLKLVHKACRLQNESNSRDFSLKTIGTYTKEQGGMSWRSIYNRPEYIKLIEAWKAYTGPAEPVTRAHKKALGAQASLGQIEDPAVQSIIDSNIIERDKLHGDNKCSSRFLAKSSTNDR